MARIQPTTRERIDGMRHWFDTFCAADTSFAHDARVKMAESVARDWDKNIHLVGTEFAEEMLNGFRHGSWKNVGEHLPMPFKIRHRIPPTEQQLAAGPESGWWFIKSTIAPFSSLPGIPYIHIPGMAWLVTGTSGLAPICRISTSP